jgi:anti-anti-sigma factor
MGIQNWSDNLLLVNLSKEPDMGEELLTVISMITEQHDLDVVVDFADVDIITSSSVAKLLKLRKVTYDNGRKLIFSSVRPKTKSIFNITGLDNVFDFVNDQFLALASVQMAGSSLN